MFSVVILHVFLYSGRGRERVGGGEWVGGNIRLLNVDGKVVVTFFYLIESPFYLHEKHV